jgi:hypothetical protein
MGTTTPKRLFAVVQLALKDSNLHELNEKFDALINARA